MRLTALRTNATVRLSVRLNTNPVRQACDWMRLTHATEIARKAMTRRPFSYAGLTLENLREIRDRKLKNPPQTWAGWHSLALLEREMVSRLKEEPSERS